MSDVENLDVMLGTYAQNELDEQKNNSIFELDLRSWRRQGNTDVIGEKIRSSLNANMRVNSDIRAETSRAISSKISTQMSRRFEEVKFDLNSHILKVLNAAIEEKLLPTIRSAVGVSEGAKSTKWDLRSDGRHPNMSSQMPQANYHESDGRQQNKTRKTGQNKTWNIPKLITIGSNQETLGRIYLIPTIVGRMVTTSRYRLSM